VWVPDLVGPATRRPINVPTIVRAAPRASIRLGRLADETIHSITSPTTPGTTVRSLFSGDSQDAGPAVEGSSEVSLVAAGLSSAFVELEWRSSGFASSISSALIGTRRRRPMRTVGSSPRMAAKQSVKGLFPKLGVSHSGHSAGGTSHSTFRRTCGAA